MIKAIFAPQEDCDAEHGLCVRDPATGAHDCRCEEGFLGDGFFCKKSVIGCNIINKCNKSVAMSLIGTLRRLHLFCQLMCPLRTR